MPSKNNKEEACNKWRGIELITKETPNNYEINCQIVVAKEQEIKT